jgi:hypothetical protein
MQLLATTIGSFFVLLRNKATLAAGTFVPAFAQFSRVAREGAIVRGLVAHIERERFVGGTLLFGGARIERGEAVVLQMNATAREPESFGHLVNHFDFIVTDGSFRAQEPGEELIELGLRFGREDFEFPGKTVFGGVLGDDGFTFRCDGTGAELGVGSVGRELGFGKGLRQACR